MDELELLLEQVDELLDEVLGLDAADEDERLDAVAELTSVAGLAVREGATGAPIDRALAWVRGDGAAVVEQAWTVLDTSNLEAGLDEALGDSDLEALEEVLDDLDELAAGAAWVGQEAALLPLVEQVCLQLADAGELIDGLSDLALEMTEHKAIVAAPELYRFWFVLRA